MSNVLAKAFTILRAFTDISSTWGVRELAKYVDIPNSTVHRLLLQLQEEGIVSYNEKYSKYEYGIELIRISSIVSHSFEVTKVVKPFLEKLATKHNETFCLILYNEKNDTLIWTDKASGGSPLQYVIHYGEAQPIPFGASGKSILAFLSNEKIIEICEKENFSGEKIEEILAECEQIRKQKYIITSSERIKGAKGYASPILNSLDEPIGSIILTTPIDRASSLKDEEISKDILEATMTISHIFGH
jgi:DNA-binding IclR family transcriptional regulator